MTNNDSKSVVILAAAVLSVVVLRYITLRYVVLCHVNFSYEAPECLTLDMKGVIGSFSVATSCCIRASRIIKFVALVSWVEKDECRTSLAFKRLEIVFWHNTLSYTTYSCSRQCRFLPHQSASTCSQFPELLWYSRLEKSSHWRPGY